MIGNEKKSKSFSRLVKKCLSDERPLYKNISAHTLPSRGIIDTPELRALQKEEKRRFIEICEKYKE